ncbi:MAG TPA: hypothetical protein VF789_01355 [Thermoanaerobaculia bacterium]
MRRLQRFAFSKLKEDLENPDVWKTTWEEPRVLIQMSLPGEALATPRSVSKQDAMVQVLTAGATELAHEGRLAPLVPLALQPALDTLNAEERTEFLDRWLQPASYGDEQPDPGTIIGRSPHGQTFQAGLVFRIHPRILDSAAHSATYVLEAGLPWTGNSPPDTWSEGERLTLWTTIFQCLYVLVIHAETGETLPEKISNRVPVQPPPRKPFHSFDAVLAAGRGQSSLSQRTSARSLQETALGALVSPPARHAST